MANGSAEQRGEGTDASLADVVDFLSGSPTYRQRAQTSFVSPPAIGKLLAVRGEVAITRGKVVVVQPTVGDLVYQNDLIETGNNGLIDIAFVDGTTIRLSADAHMVLTKFVCSAEKSSGSALLHIAKGVFGFVAGKMATIGRLVIETPGGQIRTTAPAAGIGSLAFGVLTIGLIHELKAASADIALLDDGTIDYKDFKHGVFEIETKGDNPRVIVVDDPGETIVLRPSGGGFSVERVANSPAQMAQLQSVYQGTLATFSQGQQDPVIQQLQRAYSPNDHAQLQSNPNAQLQSNPDAQLQSNPSSTASAGSSTPPSNLNINSNGNNTNIGNQLAQTQNSGSTSSTVTANVAGGAINNNNTSNNGNNQSETITAQLVAPLPTETSTVQWTAATGNNWDAAAAWSDSLVPTAQQTVEILVPVNVTLSDAATAGGLVIGAGATLDIVTGGSFTISNGIISIAATGTVETTGSGTLTIDPSTINNAGTLEANGAPLDLVDDIVTNSGTLLATGGGTLVLAGDTITNITATATVEVDAGSTLELESTTIGGGIVTVDGLLDSTGNSAIDGAAISIASTGTLEVTSGTLTIDPGSINNSGMLLATGGGTLVLNDNVTNITATATVEVDAGSTLELESATISGGIVTVDGLLGSTGNSAIDGAAISIASTGTLEVPSGTLTIDPGSITNSGTLAANGGTLDVVGAITGSGSAAISGGGTLELGGTDAQTVTFNDAGTLKLDNVTPTSFTGQINGLAVGDIIDLSDISVSKAVIDGSTLIVTESNGSTLSYQIAAASGSFSGEYFSLQSDSASGTDLVLSAALAPSISGTVAAQPTTSEALVHPFSAVMITDPNSGATDTLTITLSGVGGTLSGSGLSGGDGVYTLAAASAATITTEVEALAFTPTAGAPGTSSTTAFALSDLSRAYATATVNTTTTVIDTDPAAAPSISGTVAAQPTTSEALVHPFSAVMITDPNSGATDTLTITLSGVGGTLSGSGLSGGDGVYTLAAASAATITTEVEALAFTPTAGAPGTSSTTAFALSDLSRAYATATVNTTTTVIDTDPAAAPSISGTVAAQPTTSEALVHPFSAVMITDPNSGATDTLTITLSGVGGTLSGSGLSGGDGVYTLAAASAATITTEVEALAFTPTAGAPGTSSTTAFALSDLSRAYATATVNTTTTVIDTDPAAAPSISGTVAAQPTTSEALVHPFSAVMITDPNSGATDTLTITLSGVGGTLSGSGLSGGDGVYTLAAASAATITTEVEALAFTPTAGAPGTSSTTAFALSDLSRAYATATVNTTTTVIDTDPAAAPSISGTVAAQPTTSEALVHPFSAVMITDPNSGATDTLTITLSGVGGTLSGSGLSGGDGVYTLAAASAATITTEVEALAFTPTAGAPGTSSTTAFALSDLSRAYATATVNTTTTVIDTDPAAAPSISGTVAAQPTTSEALVHPFSAVMITDPNSGATDTLTITLSGVGGTLSGSGLSGGDGVYTLAAASAATITTEVEALAFTPTAGAPGTSSTTAFALSDLSRAYATATVNTTTTVIDTDPAAAPSISGTVAAQPTTSEALVHPFSAVMITDPNSGATDTLTITLSGVGGTLSGSGLSGGDGVYTLAAASAATITTEVEALAFTPTAGAPGTSSTTAFALSDLSRAYATATVNTTTTVIDTDPAAAPSISGTVAAQPTTSEALVHPFSAVMITDPNSGATDTLTITLSGVGGTLSGSGLSGGDGVYTLAAASAATITTEVEALAFTPTAGAPGTSSTTAFALSDLSRAYATATVNTTTTVIDTDPAAAPSISGTVAAQPTTSEALVHPFSAVMITDPNSGATDTLTITLSGVGGTLSGSGLSGGDGVYTLAAASAATITTEVEALAFTPTAGAPGTSSTTAFALSDLSRAYATATVNTTTTVIDTDPAAAPSISGTVAAQPTTSEALVHPFSAVMITDPNSGATDTLTITLSGVGGTLSGSGLSGGDGVYTLAAASAATITTEVEALAFTPTAGAPGTSSTTAFALSDLSRAYATATVNTTTTVIDTDPAAAPSISGTVAAQPTTSEALVHPFSAVMITDPNSGATDTLTITLSGVGGTLSGSGLSGGDGVYTLAAASAATITTEVEALAFTPTAGAPGTSSTTAFALSDLSRAYATATVNTTTTVIDTDPAAAPSISGTVAAQPTTSEALVHPFSAVMITDPNSGATDTLTITLSGVGGTLSGSGLSGGDGVYTLAAASAATITTEVEALAFTPTAGAPGTSSTTAFALSDLSRAYATATVNTTTTVIDTDPAAAPSISGTVAAQPTTSEALVHPFSAVMITDPNSGATDTLTITLSGVGGTLSGSGLSGGDGVYTLAAASAATITTEVEALAFTPTAGAPGTSSTTAFALSDLSRAYATATVNTTTTVIDTDPAAAPSISGTVAAQPTTSEALVHPFSAVMITDPNSGATDTLTITLSGVGGTLSGSGLSGGDGVYTLAAASAATITTEVEALAFTPTAGAPGTSSTTAFALSDLSRAYATATVNTTTTVIDTDPAAAPSISGTVAAQPTTSEALVHPFSAVMITDPNSGATDTLTITLSGVGGTLSGSGLSGGDGVYTLAAASAATITTEVEALAFTPTAGAPGTSSTTAFALSDLSRAYATATVNTTTTVIDTDPAAAPSISGTVAAQPTTSEALVHPFSAVMITDPNSGATDTLTITLSGVGGTLSGSGLSGGDGVYTLAAASAATITTEVEALAFTPTAGAPGTSSTTAFALSDLSRAYATATVNTTTTVIDTDPAAAPSISGTVAAQPTTSEALVHPFSAVMITDPNSGATDTLTITLSGVGGTLSGSGLSGGDGVYTLAAASAATITTEVEALAFTPTAGAPGTSSTTAFALSDLSRAYATATVNTTTTVIDTDPAAAPSISGTVAAQPTTSEALVHPFSAVMITDPNSGATDTLTITLSGVGGTLSGSGLSGGDGVYTLAAASAATITTEVEALAFTPTAGAPGTSSTTAFALSDLSRAYATATVNTTTTVIDTDPAAAPSISGTVAAQPTTSEALVHPFSAVMITDPNSGATDTLTITLSGVGGTLSGSGLSGGDGVYTLAAASAATITTEVEALAFTPTAGAPGTSSTTAFALSDLSRAYATATVNTTTTVIDTDPAAAPSISGTVAAQPTTSEALVHPFSAVMITDPNSGATDTLTITLSGVGGTLSGSGLSGGDGVYTLAAASAATITTEVEALAFTPTAGAPGTSSTTAFALSDLSRAYATATVNTTTTVIDTDPATPTVEWINTSGGTWTNAADAGADWSTGSIPSSSDDVVIDLSGSGAYTVTIPNGASATAASLTVSSANATVLDGGTLTLGGILTLSSGIFDLASGGTVIGGTLQATGGSFLWNGGTLSGVIYDGTMNLSTSSSDVYVNDLTMFGVGGTGSGTIDLTGESAQLFAEGSETLSNATLNIGNNSSYDYLYNYDSAGAATLTLAANLTIDHVGTYAILDTSAYGRSTSEIINDGTINAGLSGGSFTIEGSGIFSNQGTIAVSNGDTLTISATSWSNSGSGAINVSGGTLNLGGGGLTFSQLGTFTHTGGTVNLETTLNDTGEKLNVGTGTGLGTLTLASGGTIENGTIADAGSGVAFAGGTLSGVIYDGTMNLSASSSNVYVTNGLTLAGVGDTGAGTINLTGESAQLFTEGSQTLSNATLNIGNNSSYDYLYNYDSAGAATLTLAANLTIDHVGTYVVLDTSAYGRSTSEIINDGTIDAGLSGGSFTIEGSGLFSNQGTIAVSNGDTLTISSTSWSNSGTITGTISVTGGTLNLGGSSTTAQLGTFSHTGGTVNLTGTLNNSGATLNVGTGTGLGTLTLASGGTIENGTIADAGSGVAFAGGTLSGVIYDGTMNLSTSSSDVYVNDLTMFGVGGTGSGTIDLTGESAQLFAEGSETLSNATLNIGNNSSYDYLYNYDSAGAATLTLAANLTIDHVGTYAILDTSAYGRSTSEIINDGTINAGLSGGSFTIEGSGIFSNQGTIAVSNGDTLTISATSWSNSGSGAINVSGGTLNLGGGGLTFSQLGTFTHTGGTVNLETTLNDTGEKLNVGTGTGLGTLTLASGGTIENGTIADAGSGVAFAGGTLSGVIYDGTMNLSASSSNVYVTNGLTLAGVGDTGAGTINLTGESAQLFTEGSQTLSNATLNIGNNSSYDYLYNYDSAGAATLTLAANLTIDHVGTYVVLDTSAYGRSTSEIINDGTIDAGLSGGSFTIEGSGLFSNQGTIAVSNGDTLTISSTSWSNSGTITGTISVTGGMLNLGGSSTTAQLGTFSHTGGTVNLTGTLNNSGATLNVGTGTGLGTLTLASGGTIENGTIADAGSGVAFAGGTLSGVIYDGTMNLSTSSSDVYVNDLTMFGVGGTGSGTIDLTGESAQLFAEGSETLSNATLNIGNNSSYDYLYNYDSAGAATLTLAANLTIDHVGTYAILDTSAYGRSTSEIINDGTINAGLSGGSFTIQGAGIFDNQGTINVSNGDTLTISATSWSNTGTINVSGGTLDLGGGGLTFSQLGTFTHTGGTVNLETTLNDTGEKLNVGTGTGLGTLTLASGGTIENGTIADAGSGVAFAGGTLSGVIYDGTMNLSASSSNVYVTNGLTLAGVGDTGAGTINLTGESAQLFTEGSQTINNATLNIGNNSNWDYLYNYDIAGAATLTLGANLTINQVGNYVQLYTSVESLTTSEIINAGTIDAEFSGGSFTIEGSGIFDNQGTINVSNGDTLTISATSFINSGTLNANGGTLDVTEAVSGSGAAMISGGGTLELGGSDAQTITYSGAGGKFTLAKPSTFTGEIAGISGSSDVLDVGGLKSSASDTFVTATSYNSAADTTLLTVTDSTQDTSASVTLVGNYTGSAWTVASDGTGGADVTTAPTVISIQGGEIAELGIVNGVTANFSGLGGTLQLDGTVNGGAVSGVDATFTGTAEMTISVAPGVTITSAALYGIGAVSAGSGALSVSTATGDTVDTVDSGGDGSAGIPVVDQATAIAASADSSITVTANGTIKSGTAEITTGGGDGEPAGILAGYEGGTSDTANAAVFGNVTVINNANITAEAGDGIRAFTYGTGNVGVNDDSGTITTDGEPLSGQTSPIEGFGNGIYALNDGVGNITVSMASGATIHSAASGIFASNISDDVPSTSSISVTADGTIESGTILTPNGSRPAGILAGYNFNSEPEADVAGSVDVTNYANITAAAGDGIRAYNYGTGNVTVTDEADTTIQTTGTNGQYGIQAFSDDGVGSVSVTTSKGDAIDSDSTGISAVNEATTIPAADDSTITVTAYGTIDSGSTLDISGSEPGGIQAVYFPGATAEPDTNVTGSVTVNNFANITAAAGWGIEAFNWGNGDVTVNDNYGDGAVTSTTVSGAQYGIGAYAESGGTGDVTVNIGANATISTSTGSNGLFGIQAFSLDAGNITVLMSAGDVVTSGSIGVAVASFAATDPADSTITVTADGTIDSGPNTQDGGYPSGGIEAGYFPNNSATPDANVQGSVSVTSDATITAAGGWGIEAFNWGTGNATVATEAGSSITNNGSSITTSVGTFAAVGIGVYAFDGGDASISNSATVYAATGIALQAQVSGGTGSGTATITNFGNVTGDGTSADPVVQITTDTGAATLTNYATGEIAPVSLSASGLAISETGGDITIYNDGTIIGDVALANTTFNNESSGVWDLSGVNTFGSGSNTIDNAGVINMVSGTTTLDVALDNTGSVDVQAGTLDISGAVTGAGSFTIGNGAILEFSSTVASGTTVYFGASTGTLMLEQPSSFDGAISASSGSLTSGDVIYLAGFNATYTTATPTTFNSSTDTTTLLVTDPHDGLSVSLTLDGNYLADTFTASSASGGADIADPPAAATIVNGGSLDISTSSNKTVTFTGATGSLIISQPDSFTGQIIGFTGTAPDAAHSDTIDLVGINYDTPHFSEAYNASTGLLTVSDGTNTASLTFVNFDGTLNFASDGNGGTLITDPPKTSPSGNSSLTTDAAPTPVELALGRDQFYFDSGWTAGQSDGVRAAEGHRDSSDNQSASVSLGGPGNDNFIFHPSLGTDVGHFEPPAAATEFDQFSSAQDQHWSSLVKADAIEFTPHSDGIMPPDLDATHWHLTLQNAVHLH